VGPKRIHSIVDFPAYHECTGGWDLNYSMKFVCSGPERDMTRGQPVTRTLTEDMLTVVTEQKSLAKRCQRFATLPTNALMLYQLIPHRRRTYIMSKWLEGFRANYRSPARRGGRMWAIHSLPLSRHVKGPRACLLEQNNFDKVLTTF
jgi:hypothetical protein